MRLIEAMFPSFVRYTTIGQTYEGRDIPALVVGPGFSNQGQPRRTLVIMGGSHAREWISTTTVNYLAWALITSYGKDPLITKFLNKFDVVFIPELNPDGIEYTWSADRLWRKSRQHTSLQFCRGLDLDHAFGYQWDGSGVHQNDPCSESVCLLHIYPSPPLLARLDLRGETNLSRRFYDMLVAGLLTID